MTFSIKCIVITFLIFIFGCSSKTASPYRDALNQLISMEPEIEVKASINKNDFRFIGIYGYSLYAPNVERKCVKIKYDIKPIKGTTDATDNYEQRLFNSVAHAYASEYNSILKHYLIEAGQYGCQS